MAVFVGEELNSGHGYAPAGPTAPGLRKSPGRYGQLGRAGGHSYSPRSPTGSPLWVNPLRNELRNGLAKRKKNSNAECEEARAEYGGKTRQREKQTNVFHWPAAT